ncbi:hypothetical protein AN644_04620 [Candidatus Epulonipiscium fishelsonii]|nr:hypothetical protein AN644_04620 [Epulopiscium sp. SCG-C06WGA-EpuloA1]
MSDYRKHSGTCKGVYFHHDLLVARKIFESGVKQHYDIGSRVDGFVAHVASFIDEIIVFDIRPNIKQMYNIKFVQKDASNLKGIKSSSIKSLSTLDAIEHFGLGRYGDPIDINGDVKAMKALQRVLAVDGRLYFAVPIGKERVEFNAHRVYHPSTIVRYFNKLELIDFSYVDDNGDLHENIDIQENEDMLNQLRMGSGIFTFTKI